MTQIAAALRLADVFMTKEDENEKTVSNLSLGKAGKRERGEGC